eukprot:CAMPEP_0172791310 /NCGR_PEP_ID=MMETSP1074-20121228/208406_1 /TAXON_ID=2916 /ORGANISM="Ceratium fusus, Strain PA161109" /LENGTH=90 /DNA_ID=CAMNT_0013628367 /DNA_START=641 /DNA_END=911 /DNA_ORIENTATION=-
MFAQSGGEQTQQPSALLDEITYGRTLHEDVTSSSAAVLTEAGVAAIPTEGDPALGDALLLLYDERVKSHHKSGQTQITAKSLKCAVRVWG